MSSEAKISCIAEPGTAMQYNTGSWRSKRPVINKDACINCLLCWMYCPDNAIVVEKGEMKGFKYSHCKGCGICANDCPRKAIVMVDEGGK